MMSEFETLEEFSAGSEGSDGTVTVKLRRMLNHRPTRFSPAPYFLDLAVGSVVQQHYGIDKLGAYEATIRFLLKHREGIAPPLH